MTRPDPLLEVFGFGALWRVRGEDQATESVGEVMTAEAGANATATAIPVATHGQAAKEKLSVDEVPMIAAPERDLPLPLEIGQPIDLLHSATVQNRTEPSERSSAIAMLDFTALRDRVVSCTDCALCETRTNAVFGVGDPHADWLFVGEGPGMNEDQEGEPFVGQAGRLLDNMLLALGLQRGAGVFIANVVKCRPPGNRDPLPDEIAACAPYLRRQIALIQPKVIVALGRFAAQTLLDSEAKIGALRGSVHRYEGVPVIVTYHPAYLLRTLSDKAKAWEDLCLARATLRARSPEAVGEVVAGKKGGSATARAEGSVPVAGV